MMIAVYFDDKALFDGLYTYWKAHDRDEQPDVWCIPAGAQLLRLGGTATTPTRTRRSRC
jgi:hypothetical protein